VAPSIPAKKLAITSPTSGGRSWTQTMEFFNYLFIYFCILFYIIIIFHGGKERRFLLILFSQCMEVIIAVSAWHGASTKQVFL
jgi:hypothetical protein